MLSLRDYSCHNTWSNYVSMLLLLKSFCEFYCYYYCGYTTATTIGAYASSLLVQRTIRDPTEYYTIILYISDTT